MKVAKFALDSAGRMMINTMTPTGPSNVSAQNYLMYSACVNAAGVAVSDHVNGGFRYSSVGALRMYDATSALPTVNVQNGVSMTTDGEVCYTTGAIGSDVTRNNGVAVDTSGRVYVTDVTPVAWYQYGQGITEAGQGVSVWADKSGNANDLLQGTDGARPPKQSDGSILFNGVDEYLGVAFTLNAPQTVYLLGRQVTWTADDVIYDGNSDITMMLQQTLSGTPPQVHVRSAISGGSPNSNFTVNTYAVAIGIFDSSALTSQINNTAPVTDAVAGSNAGGFTLGTRGNKADKFGNIQVKEVVIFPVAHAAATRWNMVKYLSAVGNI